MPSTPIFLRPSTVARGLGTVAILLLLASTAGQTMKFLFGHNEVKGLVLLFFLDQEQNIPSFFCALLLFIAAQLLALTGVIEYRQKGAHAGRWVLLALLFLYISYDEAFQVHEGLVAPVRALLGEGRLGIFYFAWVIPAIALLLLIGLCFLGFMRDLPRATRRAFLLAAALFIGGAMGMELIAGAYVELHGSETATYSLLATVEECLEMGGVIFFIRSILAYLGEHRRGTLIRFAPAAPAPATGQVPPSPAGVEIKAFVPARDFPRSQAFYRALGFEIPWVSERLAQVRRGHTSFLLQAFAPAGFCENFQMHLLVEQVDDWHAMVIASGVAERFGVQVGTPQDQPWGMRDFVLSDPSGVHWRIAQHLSVVDIGV